MFCQSDYQRFLDSVEDFQSVDELPLKEVHRQLELEGLDQASRRLTERIELFIAEEKKKRGEMKNGQ